jgi:hypothetical protein
MTAQRGSVRVLVLEDEMTGTGPSQGGMAVAPDARERALSYAKDVMRQGMPAAAVEEVLRAQGFDAATASAIVQQANQTKNERRVAGRRLMIAGAVFCAIGITLTAGTYLAAEHNGGGTYVIWWGLVVFGAIQFFRGLNQTTDK